MHQANACLNKGVKMFKGTECTKSYANKQNLQDHQAQKHSGDNDIHVITVIKNFVQIMKQ